MISYLLETILNTVRSRVFLVSVIFIGVFTVLILRIFNLQIIRGDEFTNDYVAKMERTIYSSGTRGKIYDTNGNVLAYNKLANGVVIEDTLESSETKSDDLNQIISKTIDLIEKYDGTVDIDFPISMNQDGVYSFNVSDTLKKTFLINFLGSDEYNSKAAKYEAWTAADVMNYLSTEKYEISSKDYDTSKIFKITAVRYGLTLTSYSKYIKTTIASDVNDQVVAAIYENKNDLPGVSISQDTIRVYNDSIYFAPIIGYTGRISETELAEFTQEDKDYISTDIVGKSGIEASMEEYLQGTKGHQNIFVDATGKTVMELDGTDSTAGDDVTLTLDRDLQVATYHLLEQKIAGILLSNLVNADVNKDAYANADSDSDVEIKVPIKDVYYQLINNNVIDISKLNRKKASSNEKNIYSKFKARRKTVLNNLRSQLEEESGTILKDLEDEYQDYQYYIYDILTKNQILLSSKIDTTNDETYQNYYAGKISLREFLEYAIKNEWIDFSLLTMDEKYTDTQDIYQALLDQSLTLLKTDTGFYKKIYYYMIYDGSILGGEVCMVLYDQKILTKDKETWYNSLSTLDSTVSYKFIRKQIESLSITPAQIALDPCSGSVVITDPNTGAVRAMVTYPSYDNNMLSGSVDAKYWAKLTSDSASPLVSRCTQMTIAPGSTFKMVSAITGLEEGVISTGETINDTGTFEAVTPSPKCWIYPGAHGPINVTRAIGVSCNYFFYEVGYRLGTKSDGSLSHVQGLKKLEKYATALGLNQKSGVEISESSPIFSNSDVVRSAIGQGTHGYTGVQLARYVSTLANGGNNYPLTLVKKIKTKGGDTVYKLKAKADNKVKLADSTWNVIYEGMKQVTATGGTVGSVFADLDMTVAGKTGTAQENKSRYDHGLFVGFAPANDPDYAFSVIIPNCDSSSYPAEVAKNILQFTEGKTSLKSIVNGTANGPETEKTSD